jgi:hypothetical protein
MESKSSHTRYPNSIARTAYYVPRRMYRKPRKSLSLSLAPYLSKYLLAFLRYFDSSNLGTLCQSIRNTTISNVKGYSLRSRLVDLPGHKVPSTLVRFLGSSFYYET